MFSAALNCPGTIQLTVLNCDVEEKNIARKEFYTLLWEDLTMETRQQERTALLERNSVCHEQYEKQQQDTCLVQRSPYLNIQMGRLGEKMRQYQLPYKNVLPVPLFMPGKLPVQHSPAEEWKPPMMNEQTAMSNGYATAKRGVEQIKKDLPKLIQPAKLDFQISSLVSHPHMALQPMV